MVHIDLQTCVVQNDRDIVINTTIPTTITTITTMVMISVARRRQSRRYLGETKGLLIFWLAWVTYRIFIVLVIKQKIIVKSTKTEILNDKVCSRKINLFQTIMNIVLRKTPIVHENHNERTVRIVHPVTKKVIKRVRIRKVDHNVVVFVD